MIKLAIVSSHPIQYNAPFFAALSRQKELEVKVFYSWQGPSTQNDPNFGHSIEWDIPLLEGYAYEFVDNVARDPGSHHFRGLDNPHMIARIEAWNPDAVLVYGWASKTHLSVIRHFHKKKPVFFLAELNEQITQGDYNIYISGAELARDLTSPIAMSQQNNIFIRRESLYRMIWEKTEEWGWHKNKNAMFQAMNFYPFTTDKERALEQMTEQELNTLILHEIGEIESSRQLAGWRDMLSDLPRSQADIMLRAIKDLIADCHSTLPALINNRVDASVHFFFANFTHMRKELAPAMVQAYQQWSEDNNHTRLLSEVNRQGEHWLNLAEQALAQHAANGDVAIDQIEQLIKTSTL